ncbi:MAG TPA: hypothetical protein VGJ22_01860, partial [Anaerolineales bacterium]
MIIPYSLDIPRAGITRIHPARIIKRLAQVLCHRAGMAIALIRSPELHRTKPQYGGKRPPQGMRPRGVPQVTQHIYCRQSHKIIEIEMCLRVDLLESHRFTAI